MGSLGQQLLLWAGFIALMPLLVGRFKPIAFFLKGKFFLFLGRVSYSIMTLFPFVALIYYFQLHSMLNSSGFSMFYHFMGLFFFTFLLGLFATLLL